MRGFEAYVEFLEVLAKKAFDSSLSNPEYEQIAAVLDGQAAKVLRETVPLALRRPSGAFFTGPELAMRAVGHGSANTAADFPVFDPACGTGDLLLAQARRLPIQPSLKTTLTSWEGLILGLDLHELFVRASKARLVLLAVDRGAKSEQEHLPNLDCVFPNIRTGNGLADTGFYPAASHILMNPPYTRTTVPDGCSWAGSVTSEAALFIDTCITEGKPGTNVTAILPDVLRTGTLYRKWRERVMSLTTIESVEPFGVFDPWADVDVFILRLSIGESNRCNSSGVWWKPTEEQSDGTVDDRFKVHVGPLVPFRDRQLGDWHPYVHSRIMPVWGIVNSDDAEKRRFLGRTTLPPLVVVRRTSRPGMRYRAGGTMITGDKPIAVENHLLTLEPRDGSEESCVNLLAVLRDDRTNEWLDQRIRCRHLTVSSIRELPWWTD